MELRDSLKVKQDRYGASIVVQKLLNLTPIPAIGSTSKLNYSHTNKINLRFRFSESFADPSRPSVQPLTHDTRHAFVGKESGIGVLAASLIVACVWMEKE